MTLVVTSSLASSTLALAPTNLNRTSDSQNKGFWHSPGKVAGTFVAVGIVALAILLLIIWFFFIRPRRKQKQFEEQYGAAVLSPRGPHNPNYADSMNYPGNRSSSGSQGFVYADEKGIIDTTPRTRRNSFDDESADFANPHPIIMDQRLDPHRLLSQENPSAVSLADDIDYSRKVLRVINE